MHIGRLYTFCEWIKQNMYGITLCTLSAIAKYSFYLLLHRFFLASSTTVKVQSKSWETYNGLRSRAAHTLVTEAVKVCICIPTYIRIY